MHFFKQDLKLFSGHKFLSNQYSSFYINQFNSIELGCVGNVNRQKMLMPIKIDMTLEITPKISIQISLISLAAYPSSVNSPCDL